MVDIELTGKGGKVIASFPFPSSAKEVTYSQFLKFEHLHRAKEDWYNKHKEKPAYFETAAFRLEYVRHVIKIVEGFTGQKTGLGLFGDPVESFKQWLGVRKVDISKTEKTVTAIYANIWKVLLTYEKPSIKEGEAYSFDYKGKTYSLSASYRDALTNNLRFDSLTTAQLIEALEAARIYEMHKSKDPEHKFLFTTVLNLVACLALEEGQSFPDKQSDIDRFISDRVVYFQGLNMEVCQQVKFFFWQHYDSLKKNDSFYWFFNPPKQILGKMEEAERKAYQKQAKKNKEVSKRIGHRYIYERLLESGAFNGYRQTPHQSVRAIAANDALTEISRQNAKL